MKSKEISAEEEDVVIEALKASRLYLNASARDYLLTFKNMVDLFGYLVGHCDSSPRVDRLRRTHRYVDNLAEEGMKDFPEEIALDTHNEDQLMEVSVVDRHYESLRDLFPKIDAVLGPQYKFFTMIEFLSDDVIPDFDLTPRHPSYRKEFRNSMHSAYTAFLTAETSLNAAFEDVKRSAELVDIHYRDTGLKDIID